MAKTALITGAAVRIGREIALSLADAGFDIVIHYHTSKKPANDLAALIEKKKRKAWLAHADLRKPDDVKKLVPSLSKKGIKLDCLINNAAVFEKDRLANLTEQSWQNHMITNLFSPLQLMRDFAAQYKGRNGNIINITDGIAGWSVSPQFLSYSLSKIGLENATRLLADDLAPRIRVNAIAPGPTVEGKHDNKDTFSRLQQFIPLERTSSIKEVCDTVRYILSTPSLTGQTIALSGGLL